MLVTPPVLLDQLPIDLHLQENRETVVALDVVGLLDLVPEEREVLVELFVEDLEACVVLGGHPHLEHLHQPPKEEQHPPEIFLLSHVQLLERFVGLVDHLEKDPHVGVDDLPKVPGDLTTRTCP
jgi:ubiquinone biosynthesis protein UbiJ